MALSVFYSYAHEDQELRDRLEIALAGLRHQGLIESWHDRCIGAGEEWQGQIDKHINSADIILLLISPDFIASDYCYGIEMQRALERHRLKQAKVIPIILEPVDWSGAPFAKLQPLPRDGKPVTLWTHRNEAFLDIANGIREVVRRYHRPAPAGPFSTAVLPDEAPRSRVLDAALPSQVVQGRATELLVLIRLPGSAGLNGALLADDDADPRPQDVRSKPFEVMFPLGTMGQPEPLKVTIEVTSPDFHPASQRKNVFIPVNADSEICAFVLTPQRTGQLTVFVELQWEDAQRGHRRLRTNCLGDTSGEHREAPMNVVSMPLMVLITPPPADPPRGHMSVLRGSWVPILVALIGVLGASIAAIIGKLPELSCDRPAKSIAIVKAPFSVSDLFKPGDFMGDGENGENYLEINEGFTGNPRPGDSDGICTRIRYKQRGEKGFAGIYWAWPDHNWGDKPGRRVVGASKISFWAAGENGREVVEFKAGGIEGKQFFDTFQAVLGQRRLTKEWTRFEIDLQGKDLSDVIGGFAWDAAANWNDFPLTFYLDDIRYE